MNIDKEYTFWGTLFNVVRAWLLLFVFVTFILWSIQGSLQNTIITDYLTIGILINMVSVGVLVYFFGTYFIKRQLIKKRKNQIVAYAKSHNLSQEAPKNPDERYPFGSIAINELDKVTNYRSINHIYTKDWTYGDVSYDVMRRTKDGNYKSYTVNYAAMITTLPRKLPNVFFDSKKSRGRQFRFDYKRSQLNSLEGNFDKYFATYFPESYTIDSLSFISPDVMQTLIAASDYDIEIKDNTLCIFGSLHNPQQQITEMEKLLSAIRKELMDNILTYRDERLAGEAGRQTVTSLGLSLKRSHFLTYVSTATSVIFIIVYILIRLYIGR